MPQTIQTLLTQYLSEVQKIYGAHLKSVILYGSYARGDYSSDSDVDIMLLVDLTPEEMDCRITGSSNDHVSGCLWWKRKQQRRQQLKRRDRN